MKTKTNNEKWINWLYANKSPGGSTPYILLEIFRQSALPDGDMERIFGRAIGMMHYWKCGNSWKYFLRQDVEEAGKVFLEKLMSDPNFVDFQYAEAEKRVDALAEASIRMSKADLKISDNGLLKSLYEDVAKNYWRLGFYGVMPVVFGDFTLEPLINEHLLSLNLDHALHNEVLIAFTRARKQTGVQKWMLSLDELVAEVRRSDSLSSVFESPTIEVVSQIRGSEFYDRLTQHINQYGWVFYKWTVPMKSTEFFIDEIKSTLGKQKKSEVESLESIVKREQHLMKKCGIDSLYRSYLGALKTLVEMKNLKADGMSFASYHLHRFREELSRRFGLEIDYT